MNIFRLVLCMAGLAVYLIVRQYVTHETHSGTSRPSKPGPSPEAQQGDPRSPRPQTNPHEFLKSDRSYVDAKR